MGRLRTACLIVIMFLPWRLKRFALTHFFGYKIAPDCHIGICFIDAQSVEMCDGSSVGSFTVIRNLEHLYLGPRSSIGTFNWIFGLIGPGSGHFSKEVFRKSALRLQNDAAVTSRHLIDCIDSIDVGSFSIVAGFRSQLLTHSINLRDNRQGCAPIKIGSYCFIGTGSVILKGCTIPDYCVIGAASVVAHDLPSGGFLYRGNPVRAVCSIDTNKEFFSRTKGFVE